MEYTIEDIEQICDKIIASGQLVEKDTLIAYMKRQEAEAESREESDLYDASNHSQK